MNKEQMIALLESARTDIIGGDSWLGIIDLCSNIADWTEQDEYEFAFDTLKAVQRLWRRMYPKLDGLIYGKELTVTLDDELFSNLKKFAESLPSHTQYDKVSHERHIEYDRVSHGKEFDRIKAVMEKILIDNGIGAGSWEGRIVNAMLQAYEQGLRDARSK